MFYGESNCQSKKPCKNKAYYIQDGKYLCGVHARKDERKELPKNPNAAVEKQKFLEEQRKECERVAKENKEKGDCGTIIMTKLRMMKNPEYLQGYLAVFPNFKHQNRKDGFGCSSLSPKSIGPVIHRQPGLPDAKTLEDFHQQSKCFPDEVGDDGKPLPSFYEAQKEGFLSGKAERHKKQALKIKGNKNIPKFFVWIDKDGEEHHLTYIESRQFYCNFYERAVKHLEDFKKLKKLSRNGFNLQIFGYDSFEVGDKSMEDHYLDPSKPFGHEAVLYTMLTEKPENYPWRKYKSFDF